ncbi:PREDICTED: zinc finger protein 587B-like [Miniopterus natalensis]|uniref:zinc finger protein 587B-like n=1 Tax=Miniopterus natalensis TaxID=291302 RepID=UPI0007A6A92F|nr:PREDICTED: zinc finger protein 587B-like [Miniopterus natalensis]
MMPLPILIVNMYFLTIYLCSGCCCGPEDMKAPFEQSVSVGVSQASTSKAALSSLKTQFCESCGPVLRNIFQLTEHQETPHTQTVFRCEEFMKQLYFSANFQKHQKQHLAEKPFRSTVDRALLLKSYNFHVSEKPFTCDEVGKDFLATSEHVQQQTTHTREEANRITQCSLWRKAL